MRFIEFFEIHDLVLEFDECLSTYVDLTEAHLADLGVSNVIQSGLDHIQSPNVKSVVATLAYAAMSAGKKTKDILALMSHKGISKIKDYVNQGIIKYDTLKLIRDLLLTPDEKPYVSPLLNVAKTNPEFWHNMMVNSVKIIDDIGNEEDDF